MKLNISKKQASLLALVAFLAVAMGFAAASIVFKNKSTVNQIIAQSTGTTSSGNIADIENCMQKPQDEQQKCMDDFMVEYFKGRTTKQVLADVEAARATSTTIENDCHPIVHAIGRETYKLLGNIGDAFQ